MSKSYDLSTSTKWANLADGDHVVKLRARGSGYGSSSFSNSVTVTKGATGETWVLNDVVYPSVANVWNVDFVSNGINYSKFSIVDAGIMYQLVYGDTVVFSDDTSTWINDVYRTVTFSVSPTGDLLTWLQANGTKQG
nr:MAG TPA: hypothetical protein [Caudoviricetes sp.]